LHEINNNNEITVVNFTASKNQIVKSTMIAHRRIHKCILNSPEEKGYSQNDPFLTDRRWQCSILDVHPVAGADCHSDHSLVTESLRAGYQ
jgi:hypothetical protein